MGFGGEVLTGWELEEAVVASRPPASKHGEIDDRYGAGWRSNMRRNWPESASPARAVPAKPANRSAIYSGESPGGRSACWPWSCRAWRERSGIGSRVPYSDVPPFSKTTFDIDPPADKKVNYGDPLDIRAAIRGEPVDAAELVLEDESGRVETLPMFPEPDSHWRASLAKVTSPAIYYVRSFRARSEKHSIERDHRSANRERPLPHHSAGLYESARLRRAVAQGRRFRPAGREGASLGDEQPAAFPRKDFGYDKIYHFLAPNGRGNRSESYHETDFRRQFRSDGRVHRRRATENSSCIRVRCGRASLAAAFFRRNHAACRRAADDPHRPAAGHFAGHAAGGAAGRDFGRRRLRHLARRALSESERFPPLAGRRAAAAASAAAIHREGRSAAGRLHA